MVGLKSVKFDGESIYVFNSAIYIFESALGRTLELDLIVSEIVLQRYQERESLIVEIELEDTRLISSFMYSKAVPGKLPQLHLFCELTDEDDYPELLIINEGGATFPNIEEGITLEEIRKVEMPDEKISLKLTLPINQVEWLKAQKKKDLNSLFKKWLASYLKEC